MAGNRRATCPPLLPSARIFLPLLRDPIDPKSSDLQPTSRLLTFPPNHGAGASGRGLSWLLSRRLESCEPAVGVSPQTEKRPQTRERGNSSFSPVISSGG